jgi:hypothetical protein
LIRATCVRPRKSMRRLIGTFRYSFLNSRTKNCSEIGEDSQGRYAPLHFPDHIPHAMNSAPQVRQRFPSRFVEAPSHTHPRLRLDSHADELEKAGRSQRSAFIFWVPLLGATTLSRSRRELRNHESDLPSTGL